MAENLDPVLHDRGNITQISDMPPDVRGHWLVKLHDALVAAVATTGTAALDETQRKESWKQAAEFEAEVFHSSSKRAEYVSGCHDYIELLSSKDAAADGAAAKKP